MGKSYLKRVLSGVLTPDEMGKLVTSFDIVGDIAIVKIPEVLEAKKQFIAATILKGNRSLRTVLHQVSPVSGPLRLRTLRWVAGEEKMDTIYREYGCAFQVDLSAVYFSPRLSFERMRIAKLVEDGEVVLNMFAGIGCFSIVLAKHSAAHLVYSIDLNPRAVALMTTNIALNHLEGRVQAICGDAKAVVENQLRHLACRVLMPLPAKALKYLEAACLALKSDGGFIHFYDFVYAKNDEDAIAYVTDKVEQQLDSLGQSGDVIYSRVVRTVGPNWNQVVLDICV